MRSDRQLPREPRVARHAHRDLTRLRVVEVVMESRASKRLSYRKEELKMAYVLHRRTGWGRRRAGVHARVDQVLLGSVEADRNTAD